MSATFIYTPSGWANLAKVDLAAFKKDPKETGHQLMSNGQVIDPNNLNFGNTVVSVVACQGEFEYLTFIEGDDEHPDDEILVEPVLAWGLTALGSLVPMTPTAMDGETDKHYALRKAGSPRVYSDQNTGGWPDAVAWLASVLGRPPKLPKE